MRNNEKWSKKREALFQARLRGKSFKAIGKVYRVTPQRMQQIFKRLNIDVPSFLRRHTALVKELYDSGATSEEIAPLMGCTPKTVLNVLIEEGVQPRGAGQRHVGMKKEAKEFLKSFGSTYLGVLPKYRGPSRKRLK